MKYLITIIIGIIVISGIVFLIPQKYDSQFPSDQIRLGTIGYPSSVDSLVNPSAGDSVATVSHSAQHANANDAVEALETKLGTTASTAVNNSILTGNGTGSSIWTTYATSTSFSSTLMSATTASTTNLTAYGSSTLQNFTAVDFKGRNATTTQATTTNLAITKLSNQIPYANSNGSVLPVTIGTNMSFSGGILSSTLSSYYFGATSSLPYLAGFGLGQAQKAATTTSITQGEGMLIWFKAEGANSVSYILNVKSTGQGTTTLDTSTCPNTATPCMFSLMGMYTASTTAASGNIEIYVSTAAEPRSYINLNLPGFMYIRFSN